MEQGTALPQCGVSGPATPAAVAPAALVGGELGGRGDGAAGGPARRVGAGGQAADRASAGRAVWSSAAGLRGAGAGGGRGVVYVWRG